MEVDGVGPLPDGWVENFEPTSGLNYYFNLTTQESVWERPLPDSAAATVPDKALPLPDGWVARFDETYGLEYFFDLVNQSSVWERPTAPPEGYDASSFGAVHSTATADAAMSADAPVSPASTPNADTAAEAAHVLEAHAAADAPQLPDGWVARFDETYGLEYFFDLVNQSSVWERPTAPPEGYDASSFGAVQPTATAADTVANDSAGAQAATAEASEPLPSEQLDVARGFWSRFAPDPAHDASSVDGSHGVDANAAEAEEAARSAEAAEEAASASAGATEAAWAAVGRSGAEAGAEAASADGEDGAEAEVLRESAHAEDQRREAERARAEQEELELAMAISMSMAEEEVRRQGAVGGGEEGGKADGGVSCDAATVAGAEGVAAEASAAQAGPEASEVAAAAAAETVTESDVVESASAPASGRADFHRDLLGAFAQDGHAAASSLGLYAAPPTFTVSNSTDTTTHAPATHAAPTPSQAAAPGSPPPPSFGASFDTPSFAEAGFTADFDRAFASSFDAPSPAAAVEAPPHPPGPPSPVPPPTSEPPPATTFAPPPESIPPEAAPPLPDVPPPPPPPTSTFLFGPPPPEAPPLPPPDAPPPAHDAPPRPPPEGSAGVFQHTMLSEGASHLATGETAATLSVLARYEDAHLASPASLESQCLRRLVAAYEARDAAAFTATLREYDEVIRLDAQTTSRLLEARATLQAAADAANAVATSAAAAATFAEVAHADAAGETLQYLDDQLKMVASAAAAVARPPPPSDELLPPPPDELLPPPPTPAVVVVAEADEAAQAAAQAPLPPPPSMPPPAPPLPLPPLQATPEADANQALLPPPHQPHPPAPLLPAGSGNAHVDDAPPPLVLAPVHASPRTSLGAPSTPSGLPNGSSHRPDESSAASPLGPTVSGGVEAMAAATDTARSACDSYRTTLRVHAGSPHTTPEAPPPPPPPPPPASCDATTQLDDSDVLLAARGMAAAGTEAEETIRMLREQLSHVRRRSTLLEQRLDGEGAVLLVAHQRHQQQLHLVAAKVEQLGSHAARGRAYLAASLSAAQTLGSLRLVVHAWRQEARSSAAQRAAVSRARLEVEVAAATLAAAAKPPASALLETEPTLPALPPLVDRKELYRSSYEALIDRVLEMQQAFHDYASASGHKTAAKAASSVGAADDAHTV